MLETVTNWVNPDEKAYALVEINGAPLAITGKPGVGQHRYQVIWVNRNDTLAAYATDLGPAAKYRAGGLRVLALWEHTVAELQHIGDDFRSHGYLSDVDMELNHRKNTEETFLPRFEQYMEEGHRVLFNESSFGPGISKQRNGAAAKLRRR